MKYKKIDYKLIIYNKFSYSIISNYLNSKFFINSNYNNNKIKNTSNSIYKKKIIKLFFIDFLYSSYRKKQINKIIEILNQKFSIIISKNNPDYLIYNVFGCQHLSFNFSKSIKISYYTENQIPDFNAADYAVGQSHINFLDRYLKIPYVMGYFNSFNNSLFKFIRRQVLKNRLRKKFCAAVISNNNSYTKFRLNFINELSKYKKVDMGGKYKNNVGIVKNKITFLSSYKFSIAMENSEGDGYFSEKIIESFLSGTIPIYYGDYMIDEYINPKAYILIKGEKDMQQKIEYIKKIDKNDNLYKNILKENIINDIKFKEKIENIKIQFLIHIFEQDINKAKRIDNYHWK